MIVKHAFTGSKLSKTGKLRPNKVATFLKQNSATLEGVNNVLNNNKNECVIFDLSLLDHIFKNKKLVKNLNAWQALESFETIQ